MIFSSLMNLTCKEPSIKLGTHRLLSTPNSNLGMIILTLNSNYVPYSKLNQA